jgi:hypothetical protein
LYFQVVSKGKGSQGVKKLASKEGNPGSAGGTEARIEEDIGIDKDKESSRSEDRVSNYHV